MYQETQELFNPVQEKQLLWFALRSLKLIPPAEFFTLLEEDSIVEVFMDGKSVYRTFNYFSVTSYS